MCIQYIKKTLLILLMSLTSACSLTPQYSRPEMPVPAQWPEGEAYKDNASYKAEQFDLQTFIKDERLHKVITLALESNRDLRSQIADVEAARATYRIQRAAQLPSLYGGGSAGKNQATANLQNESYGAEIGLSSFEIDLFGKNRNLKDAALELYLASEQTAEAAKISLIAETANAWLSLAADKQMLSLAENTALSTKKSVEIAQSRYETGVTSRMDVYQAETLYQQAKVDVANFTAVVAQDINALELLAGQSVDKALLPDNFEHSENWLGNLSAGISSNILLQRPDIAAAEHTLKSANANIGAARAAFFPSISLVSSAGLTSSALSNLFSGGSSSIWSFIGNLTLPIFSGGSNKAKLEYAKAKYNSYLAQYDKTIQTAFQEVADALARKGTIYEQIEAQTALVNTSQLYYELAEKRYKSGIDTYLNVLQAQRTYYTSKQELINTTLLELNNRITLYRVLGGTLETNNNSAT